MESNPYDAPTSEIGQPPAPREKTAGSRSDGTILPRSLAATVDNIVALILGVIAAKSLPSSRPILQVSAFIGVYLGYFLLSEGLWARTLGKWSMGLVVTNMDGTKSGWRAAVIRTLFRIVEVNPALLGAIPAALGIVTSEHRQRYGDRVAKTMVIPVRRAKKAKS